MVGVFPIHVTLSDSSDDRAVLYYGEEMIFFHCFFVYSRPVSQGSSTSFLSEKWGFDSCFPRAKPSLEGPPSLF